MSHFPGKVGVVCLEPGCNKFFSRSNVCGAHMEKHHPNTWSGTTVGKGSQDHWGGKVGWDLIEKSLVDGDYIALAKDEF